ncbi:hypothetical protein SAMN05444157_2666 [Frankineae bacterium MT45]|nr:hypothetical protein SAMN05444157_2666 [Frankineae bacterium MT45]
MSQLLRVLIFLALAGLLWLCIAQSARLAPRNVDLVLDATKPAAEVRNWVNESFAASLRPYHYTVMTRSDRETVLRRVRRSWVTWYATLITLPIGLIFLVLFRRTDTVTLRVQESVGSTKVVISGALPVAVIEQLTAITEPDLGGTSVTAATV